MHNIVFNEKLHISYAMQERVCKESDHLQTLFSVLSGFSEKGNSILCEYCSRLSHNYQQKLRVAHSVCKKITYVNVF